MGYILFLIVSFVSVSTSFAFTVGTTSYSSRKVTSILKMSSEEALTLEPSKTAVLFIEYQNEFTTEGGALYGAVKDCLEKYDTIENSKKLMAAAREAGVTIVHAPISFDKGHNAISKEAYGILSAIKEGKTFTEGEWSSEFCEGMKPVDDDIVVKGKTGLCSFSSTNLDFVLRQNNIQNLVLAGFLTNCCVESTMRSAYEKGYKVYTVTDCCAATSVAGQEAAFEHTFGMFSIKTTSDVIIGAVKSS